MRTPTIHIRPGHPDFLDLDWTAPIGVWDGGRLVDMPTGIHRHPVVFVAYNEGVYAIKELPLPVARHEFEALRTLEERTTRTARAVGLIERGWWDDHDEGAGVVITQFAEYAFPYRELVSGAGFGRHRGRLLDAFAGLLVELHLAGAYWGDCSLSNILYRWDGASIETVMVDAETAELHEVLSTGQRRQDLAIMEENVAGEMADIAAAHGFDLDSADLALGAEITERYAALWKELRADPVIAQNESYLIRERIARMNDLGFSVEDVELIPVDGGNKVRMQLTVGGRTYHSERLRSLIGVEASENQARFILSDLTYHEHKFGGDSPTGKAVAAMRWRATVLEPILATISSELPQDDPLQRYTDFLNHRYRLATKRGQDIPNDEAYADWRSASYPGHAPESAETGGS